MKFWSSGDGTGSRVKKKLKTIDLSSRKIEEKRVAVINFRVNERRRNSRGSRAIHKIANTDMARVQGSAKWHEVHH